MRKKLLFLFLLLTAMGSCEHRTSKVADAPTDSLSLLVMQIRKCARLYTAEYKVRKIVTHRDQLQWKGSFLKKSFSIDLPVAGTRRVAIPINATLKAYIDFDGFTEQNIHKQGNQLEIILPDPKVELTSTRIDHRNIRTDIPLLRGRFSEEELSAYEAEGRKAILKEVPQSGIIETARESAAKILIPLAEALGYPQEHIKVTFRKTFTDGDLHLLLDPTKIEHEKETP